MEVKLEIDKKTNKLTPTLTINSEDPVPAKAPKEGDLDAETFEDKNAGYKTDSEFEPNFLSDKEPPSDKIFEERLVIKRDKLRIYKKIIKIGQGRDMPSKYNKVTYRLKRLEKENLEKNGLDEAQTVTNQMGIDNGALPEDILLCIQNLKKKEMASFRVEVVDYDKVEHERRLSKEYFYQIELFDWITVIDIFGDLECMKTVLEPGKGQSRLKKTDEADLELKLVVCAGKVPETHNRKNEAEGHNEDNNQAEEINNNHQIVYSKQVRPTDGLVSENLPKSILRVCLNLKHQELCRIKLSEAYLTNEETDQTLLEKIFSEVEKLKKQLQIEVENEPQNGEEQQVTIYLEVQINQIVSIEDIFSDGTTLKKQLLGSYSTARPDPYSRIYFDYNILDSKGRTLYKGLEKQLKNAKPANDDNFQLYEASTCEKHFLDDYSLSRALRKALREGKKLERFDLIVKDAKKIKDGKDRRIVDKALEELGEALEEALPLRYEVKVYTFSVGDNGYTMGLLDKEKCYKDRRPALVRLLKTKQYKRAQKMLKFLIDILENVSQKIQLS